MIIAPFRVTGMGEQNSAYDLLRLLFLQESAIKRNGNKYKNIRQVADD